MITTAPSPETLYNVIHHSIITLALSFIAVHEDSDKSVRYLVVDTHTHTHTHTHTVAVKTLNE